MVKAGKSTGGGHPPVWDAPVLAGCSCLLYEHELGRHVRTGQPVHPLLVRGTGFGCEGWRLLAFPDEMVQGAWLGARVAGTAILGGVDRVEYPRQRSGGPSVCLAFRFRAYGANRHLVLGVRFDHVETEQSDRQTPASQSEELRFHSGNNKRCFCCLSDIG